MDLADRQQKERAERLKAARKRVQPRLTQTDVAKFLGVSQPAYAEVERGERPGHDYFDQLPQLLGVTREWLLHGDAAPVPGEAVAEETAGYDQFQQAVLTQLREHGEMLRRIMEELTGGGEHDETVRAALATKIPALGSRRIRTPTPA